MSGPTAIVFELDDAYGWAWRHVDGLGPVHRADPCDTDGLEWNEDQAEADAEAHGFEVGS